MVNSILGIIKVWIITKALCSPLLWIGFLLLFSIINLTLAVFVKFKNGLLSSICFIICELVGVVALISLISNNVYNDNLYLKEGTVQQFSDVTPEGIVYRKRFRTVTEPLLGITLPEDGIYFNQAKDNILNSRFSGSLYMYKSSAYSGVVLCDSENNSINEQLLYDGLARVSKVSPKQYKNIQKGAVKFKRGMWGVAESPSPESIFLIEFTVIWLVFILCMCTSAATTKWLKKLIVKYDL